MNIGKKFEKHLRSILGDTESATEKINAILKIQLDLHSKLLKLIEDLKPETSPLGEGYYDEYFQKNFGPSLCELDRLLDENEFFKAYGVSKEEFREAIEIHSNGLR